MNAEIAVAPHDAALVGLAEPRRRLPQGVEHGLQVECRAADDLEHVGRRRLLLQRLASSAVRACTSSNSRTFSMAITAWSAKVWTSAIWRSVNSRASGRDSEITPSTLPSRFSGTARPAR